MSSFAPSAIEEGAKGLWKGPKGPQPSAGARRKGAEHPKLLVIVIDMKKTLCEYRIDLFGTSLEY